MDKKQLLKTLINEFGIHTLTHTLNIDYKILVDRKNYEDKVHDQGLDILLQNKDLKNKMLEWVFPFEANGLMTTQDYFITLPLKAYEQLLNITEDETYINKIFQFSSNLLCKTDEDYQDYINKYVKFLATVVKQSKKRNEVEKMFEDFKSIEKKDKTDLSPILLAFIDKKIPADRVYQSIESLNNSYLENKLVEYLYENKIKFSFQVKKIDMFVSEEKIIYEDNIKFNTNYFMKMGVSESQVNKALETFSDSICNIPDINYLIKKKDKTFHLVLRSEKQEVIYQLSEQIKEHSSLISEFVENFDNTQEYKTRFMTYWHLNKKFNSKEKVVKHKI